VGYLYNGEDRWASGLHLVVVFEGERVRGRENSFQHIRQQITERVLGPTLVRTPVPELELLLLDFAELC
jgi:hypothetical protein